MSDISVNTPATIRRMTFDDLEQVHGIDVMSFSIPWPARSFRFELLENPASLSWVAEVHLPDGSLLVVGVIVVWLLKDECHIATLAVHPDYRKRGIGRKLLEEALKTCISQGASTATLEVRAGNLEAQNLYRDYGFEVVNRRSRYYSDNQEDALLMTVLDLDQEYLDWIDEDHDQ